MVFHTLTPPWEQHGQTGPQNEVHDGGHHDRGDQNPGVDDHRHDGLALDVRLTDVEQRDAGQEQDDGQPCPKWV